MEPLSPPTLDEIHDIVERRQVQARRRSRIAFTGTAVVMAAASVLGIRSLVDSDTTAEPAAGDRAPDGASTGESSTEGARTEESSSDHATDEVTDDAAAEVDEAVDDVDGVGAVDGVDGATVDDDGPQGSEPSASVSTFHQGVFYGAGFGYSQAETLARAWEQDNAWEAKAEAGRLILGGDIEAVESLVGAPLGPDDRLDDFSIGQDRWEADLLHGAFLGAGYSVEQLDRLAAEWVVDSLTAKADAGYDILTGDTIELDLLIGPPDGRF